jgi:hypothetical protein
MWVKTQRNGIVNLDGVCNIWWSPQANRFYVNALYSGHDNSVTLGRYATEKEARKEIEAIYNCVARNGAFYNIKEELK